MSDNRPPFIPEEGIVSGRGSGRGGPDGEGDYVLSEQKRTVRDI